jgi:23S rRNA (pseudouridine1915-N3)-methyltransferase
MDILLLSIGKITTDFISVGVDEYERRIKRYGSFDIKCIADIKNPRKLTQEQQKEAEGKNILEAVNGSDYVVLLDERGKLPTSIEMSQWLQKRMSSGLKRLVFVVGGPYGFSKAVYDRADEKLSLSKLTFPHELVRLFFVEQLYRCFSILRNEPYHHE